MRILSPRCPSNRVKPKQISVGSLRRVRDEMIGSHRVEQGVARLFHEWLKEHPDMKLYFLDDALRAFQSELRAES